jgi:hypothetical protein
MRPRLILCGFYVASARRRQRTKRVEASQTAGKGFAYHDLGRSLGVMRENARQGLYLLILLAAAGMAGWVLASWAGSEEITARPGQLVCIGKPCLAARSSRTTADDGLAYQNPSLRTVDVLLLSTSPPMLTLPTFMRAAKDLLSLTEQRRE